MQVRFDCPVEELVAALTDPALLPPGTVEDSDGGACARERAAAAAAAESSLLEAAQTSLGARRILRVATHLPSVCPLQMAT